MLLFQAEKYKPTTNLEAVKKMEPLANIIASSTSVSDAVRVLTLMGFKPEYEPPRFFTNDKPMVIVFKNEKYADYQIDISKDVPKLIDKNTGYSQEAPLLPKIAQTETKTQPTIAPVNKIENKITFREEPGAVTNDQPSRPPQASNSDVSKVIQQTKLGQLNMELAQETNTDNPLLSSKAYYVDGNLVIDLPFINPDTNEKEIVRVKPGQEGATRIANGKETPLNTDEANTLLKQNGYKINLDDFLIWLRKRLNLDKTSTASTTEDNVTASSQLISYNQAQKMFEDSTKQRETDAIKKGGGDVT